jgi:hypoxanthine-guanine phosphoribosyltransferase
MAEDAFGYTSREVDFFEGNPMELLNEGRAKEILIVDDINDSGATINWIMEDWPSGCLPDDPTWKEVWNNNVRFAVLVDNLASKCNTKMDYVGMEINKAENDVWVDFPWEDWWTK